MSMIWLVIIGGLLSVIYGVVTYQQVMAADAGSQRMQEISGAVAEGAQAYLKRQYTTIAGVPLAEFCDKPTIDKLVQRARDGGIDLVGPLEFVP